MVNSILNMLKELKIKKDSRIVQLGVYKNNMLFELYSEGYTMLYGIDRDKRVYNLPLNTKIRYIYGDTENTHMPNSFFDAVILQDKFAKSKKIIDEAKRILKNGGFLISNAIPTKIDSKVAKKIPKNVAILSYTKNFGGIYEYTALLAERLQTEYGVKIQIAYKASAIKSRNVILECAQGVVQAERVLKDVEQLIASGHKIYTDIHDVTFRKFSRAERKRLEETTTLLYRANELANVDGSKNYRLFPLIAYKSNGLKVPKSNVNKNKILLGSFGFASGGKRIYELMNLADKLNVNLKLLFTANEEPDPTNPDEFRDEVLRRAAQSKNIIVKFGTFTDKNKKRHFDQKKELIDELSECTHFIFSMKDNLAPSASMQFVKMFNKPIICLNIFQAKQMQVIRFKCFSSRLSAFAGFLDFAVMQTGSSILKGANVDWGSMIRETVSYFTPDQNGKLTLEFLKSCNEITREEDGIKYLVEIIKDESDE